MNKGKFKVRFDRMRSYGQLIMMIYLTVVNTIVLIASTGLRWWYSLFIGVIVLFIIFLKKIIAFDEKVLAEERDYIWTRPGKLNDLINNVEEIKKKLDA